MVTINIASDIAAQATQLQGRASNPDSHIWVAASAGTGKTKVLTDRVLRLLLPGHVDPMIPEAPIRQGADPSKILCITFTKAAAAEMAERVQKILVKWLGLSDDDLAIELTSLLGVSPSSYQCQEARRLFARVVDVPGGMKIMTIHSFCQSILKRFPLEAGLNPHFDVMTDRAATEELNHIVHSLFQLDLPDDAKKRVDEATQTLSRLLNEDEFQSLMRLIVNQRSDFLRFFHNAGGLTQALDMINRSCGFDTENALSEAYILNDYKDLFDLTSLQNMCDFLCAGAGNELKYGLHLASFLEKIKTPGDKPSGAIKDILLSARTFFIVKDSKTKKDKPRYSLFKKTTLKQYPDFTDQFSAMYDVCRDFEDRILSMQLAQVTREMVVIAFIVIDSYRTRKQQKNILDFDDQIVKTIELLTTADQAAWVLYKLDGGIDHLLVDEAQDTNPDQWRVIEAITEEFFSGEGRERDHFRSVFVVGDEKQSIYSFQKADPQKFKQMQDFFKQRTLDVKEPFETIALNQSFRSTRSVLNLVDRVFALPDLKKGVTLNVDDTVRHHVFRQGQASYVSLWPIATNNNQEPTVGEDESWPLPVHVIESIKPERILADGIAQEIEDWLRVYHGNQILDKDHKSYLESENRAVEPKDIMILLRKRGQLMHEIVRALKNRHLPVAGVDVLKISQSLAVQDLIVGAQFGLLNEDDLALATFLKTPIMGLNDDDLMAIRLDNQGRQKEGSLWRCLLRCDGYDIEKSYLRNLIKLARTVRPYDFFATLLNQPVPASEISGLQAFMKRLGVDSLDSLQEFMGFVLDFEQKNRPSLQEFLHWFEADDESIKREADSDETNQIRIMTVHGSKGLQAPIVILGDATVPPRSSGANTKKLYWQNSKTTNGADTKVPLWSPRTAFKTSKIKLLEGMHLNAEQEEHRRLLYVALTRAADRLYITGALKDPDKCHADSWYKMVERGLRNDADGFDAVTIENSFSHLDLNDTEKCDLYQSCWSSLESSVLKTAQDHDVDNDRVTPMRKKQTLARPSWFNEISPAPVAHIKPLRPSMLHDDDDGLAEPAALSPLLKRADGQDKQKRFKRGIVLHKLLQILPDIDRTKRPLVAKAYLNKQLKDMNEKTSDFWVKEMMSVLDHPEFSEIFSPKARAEVSVTGLLNNNDDAAKTNRLLVGQIDRLLVRENDVLIVDFKTNRPSPRLIDDVPQAYLKQMQLYKDALVKIYPDKEVKAALLWTETLEFMIL